VEKGERLQMKLFRSITRRLLAFVATSFYWLEKRECERRLEERLRWLEQKGERLGENEESSD